MYCYKCGTKNHNSVNFCYKCGVSLSHLKKKKNIKLCSANFLKLFAYNKLIRSKNKYRNAYLLVASAVLSTFFVTTLGCNFKYTLNYALSTLPLYKIDTTFALTKAQSELAFRDVWCYIILSLAFGFIILCDTLIFIYTMRIKNNQK